MNSNREHFVTLPRAHTQNIYMIPCVYVWRICVCHWMYLWKICTQCYCIFRIIIAVPHKHIHQVIFGICYGKMFQYILPNSCLIGMRCNIITWKWEENLSQFSRLIIYIFNDNFLLFFLTMSYAIQRNGCISKFMYFWQRHMWNTE